MSTLKEEFYVIYRNGQPANGYFGKQNAYTTKGRAEHVDNGLWFFESE